MCKECFVRGGQGTSMGSSPYSSMAPASVKLAGDDAAQSHFPKRTVGATKKDTCTDKRVRRARGPAAAVFDGSENGRRDQGVVHLPLALSEETIRQQLARLGVLVVIMRMCYTYAIRRRVHGHPGRTWMATGVSSRATSTLRGRVRLRQGGWWDGCGNGSGGSVVVVMGRGRSKIPVGGGDVADGKDVRNVRLFCAWHA